MYIVNAYYATPRLWLADRNLDEMVWIDTTQL